MPKLANVHCHKYEDFRLWFWKYKDHIDYKDGQFFLHRMINSKNWKKDWHIVTLSF
jgi:hypothetical protein